MTSETKMIIESYLRGEISLGKLAQELDLDTVSARDLLISQGINIQTCDAQDIPSDTNNA
jgi:predicted HTH domain antitoxin